MAVPRAEPFPPKEHNHRHCIRSALSDAETACRDSGLRLTPLRRRVLELVWSEHTPVGAYDVLDRLRQDRARAAPPTVYRALEFLLDAGLIHRLESLNAYVGCPAPDDAHSGQFLICRDCNTVAELNAPKVSRALADSAHSMGFKVERETVEVVGLCPRCQKQ